MANMRGGADGVLVGLISLAVLGSCYWLPTDHYFSTHREAVKAAFNGHIDPDDTSRYEFACSWDCPDRSWMRDLPPALEVSRCKSFYADGGGACCIVFFPGPMSAEIHAQSLGAGRYKLKFDSYVTPGWGLCRNAQFNPYDPGSKEFIPCPEPPS